MHGASFFASVHMMLRQRSGCGTFIWLSTLWIVGTKSERLGPTATETSQMVLIASTRTSGMREREIVRMRGWMMVLAYGARRMRGSSVDSVERMRRFVCIGVMLWFTTGSSRTSPGSSV